MSIQTVAGHSAMHGLTSVITPALRGAEYQANKLYPNELPPIESLIEIGLMGQADGGAISAAARHLGVDLNTDPAGGTTSTASPTAFSQWYWNRVYLAHQGFPTETELREIANREFWDNGKLEEKLKWHKYIDPPTRRSVANLRFDIPGPADLVRFSVRHCWEPDLLKKLGYDLEFPGTVIDIWHAMKGLDYPLFTGGPLAGLAAATGGATDYSDFASIYTNAGLEEPTWAQMYWYSHWVLPSPGQFFQMLIRLDPNRDRSFDTPEMQGLQFTLADYELGLRANDYPVPYRRALAAINRPIVGVRFLRDFVKQGVYKYQDIVEWARRWGYSLRDQTDIADDVWRNVQAAKEKGASCKGCAACEAAFDVGILGETELTQCFTGFGASPADAQKDTQLAKLKQKTKRAREIVSNVRKRFLRGTLSHDQARDLLSNYGLTPTRVADYLTDWQLEFEAGRKEISAAAAVKYACQGLISMAELVARLTNLGYPADDQQVMLGEAQLCQLKLASQAAEKLEREDRQTKRELLEAARLARTRVLEAQRYLASHGSPKELQRWFCDGHIGECEVYSRLNALGWPDLDITRLLDGCKQTKGGPPPRQPTGTCPPGTPIVPIIP